MTLGVGQTALGKHEEDLALFLKLAKTTHTLEYSHIETAFSDEHVFSACVARLRLLRLSAKAYSSSPPSSAPLLLNSRSSMGLLCQSKWRVTIYSAPPSVAAPSPGMQKKRLAIAQKLGDKTKTTMQQEPVDSALRIPMLCWCASWSECLSSFIFLY